MGIFVNDHVFYGAIVHEVPTTTEATQQYVRRITGVPQLIKPQWLISDPARGFQLPDGYDFVDAQRQRTPLALPWSVIQQEMANHQQRIPPQVTSPAVEALLTALAHGQKPAMGLYRSMSTTYVDYNDTCAEFLLPINGI